MIVNSRPPHPADVREAHRERNLFRGTVIVLGVFLLAFLVCGGSSLLAVVTVVLAPPLLPLLLLVVGISTAVTVGALIALSVLLGLTVIHFLGCTDDR